MSIKKLVSMVATTAAIVGLTIPSGHATITQAFSLAELNQGPYTLETFESGITTPGVIYSASGGVSQAYAPVYASSVTPSGSYGLSNTSLSSFAPPLTLSFAVPTSSVGMYFGNDDSCCVSAFSAFLDIFGVGGLLGTISVSANMNDFADQFLGFTSDQLVDSVTLRYATDSGAGISNVGLFLYIDDVRFNVANATVPEPAIWTLLGIGLLGLGVFRSTPQRRVMG